MAPFYFITFIETRELFLCANIHYSFSLKIKMNIFMKLSAFKFLLPITPLFLIQACSEQPSNLFFPSEKGITWTYNVEQLTMTEPVFYRMMFTNLGKKKIDDQSFYIRKLHNNSFQYFNDDDSGFYELIKNQETKTEHKKYLFKYPLKMTTTWKAEGDPFLMRRSIDEINAQQNSMPGLSQDSPLKMEYKIASMSDSVKVPAGKFKGCMKVVGKGNCSFSSTGSFARKMIVEVINNEWYCPEVGLVKIDRRESSERVSLKPVHYVIELEKISHQ